MPLTDDDLTAALAAARDAATVASSIMLEAFRGAKTVAALTKSSSSDLVTEYDKRCENEIHRILRAHNASFEFVGEESTQQREFGSTPTWVVDPIDGTTSFVHRLFDCCVSIGLAVDGVPVLGVVRAPLLHEEFYAVRGRGAFVNDRSIRTSGRERMGESVVSTHVSYNRSARAVHAIMSINTELARDFEVRALRSYGSAALDMCGVACGRIDLYFEVGLQSWDFAAATVIVCEAGGIVDNVGSPDGPFSLNARSVVCAASSPLRDAAMSLAGKHDYVRAVLDRT